MAEKTKYEIARQELSQTIKELLELITPELILEFSELSREDPVNKHIDYLTSTRQLLQYIYSYLVKTEISLGNMLKESLYNQEQKIITSNKQHLISFNSFLTKHLHGSSLIPLKQAIDRKDVDTFNTLCRELNQNIVRFIYNTLIPSLQVSPAIYLDLFELLNNTASTEHRYAMNLQIYANNIDQHVKTKLEETNELIEKIKKTEEKVNNLTDIAIGKSAGEIYTKMAKKQAEASNWFRGFAIVTTILAFIVAIFSYGSAVKGAENGNDINIYFYLYTSMLVAITFGLATYLARQGARHRSMFEKYNFLSFKHSSFNMYIDKIVQKNLDSKEFDKSYELLKQFIDDKEAY